MEVTKKPALNPVHQVLQQGDILRLILQRVTSRSRSFTHALVCRRWLILAPVLQLSVHVSSRTKPISEATLVQEMMAFPNLTRLFLHESSMREVSGFLLGAAAFQFSHLRVLVLDEGAASGEDNITGKSLSAFFQHCPRLESFSFLRVPYPTPEAFSWPAAVSSLTSITKLCLYPLTYVSPSLGTVTSLRSLLLGGPFREVPASLSHLRLLSSLAFEGTTFNSFPDVFGSLTSLRRLQFLYSSLRSLPSSVSSLKRLRMLRLNSDQLRISPHGLDELPSLKLLDVHGGRLSSFNRELFRAPQLELLWICEAFHLEFLPEGWDELKSLRVVKMCDMPELRSFPCSFGRIPSLQKLELFGLIKLSRLPDLSGLQQLREFSLARMHGLVELPESLGTVATLEQLKLRDCPVLRVIPLSLLELPSLSPDAKEVIETWIAQAAEALFDDYE